jgi:hypothetical protein
MTNSQVLGSVDDVDWEAAFAVFETWKAWAKKLK